ncbi:MAG TPA: alpha/beta hydrolase-fold protein [Actinomycetes bacterium]|nr:alpha/beta hydrolase-fold protein [Actinomycetes bacterium]
MRLEQHVVSSGEYSRSIWYHAGPQDTPHALCIFLDGEHYTRDLDALPVLEALLGERGMPPLSLVFVSHVSSDPGQADYAGRQTDFACNERYARYIATEVAQWAQARNKGIRATGHLICGLSLSGLQAAYVTCRHPGTFTRCLSQSGSFWWLDGKEDRLSPTAAKFWLSVGDQETAEDVSHSPELFQKISQVAGVERAAASIEELGGTVRLHKFSGGHGPAPWREELAPALRWLLTPG